MSRPENELEIDHAAIAAEAAAIELPENSSSPSGVEGGAAAPTTSDAASPMPAASWSEVTPGLVVALDLAVCPNWKLSDDEKTALSEALAPALDQLFPGGIGDERHAPYFRLLAVTVAIAGSRFDRETFRFKPLREKTTDDAAGTAEPGAPRGKGAAPASGGSFTMAPSASP